MVIYLKFHIHCVFIEYCFFHYAFSYIAIYIPAFCYTANSSYCVFLSLPNEFVGECFILSNFFYISPSYLSLTPDWRGIFWKEYSYSTSVCYTPFNLCSCKALWVFICIYKYLKSPIWSRRMKIIMVKSLPKWQKMEHKV